jgi:ATP-binding cassette subfamily B protein
MKFSALLRLAAPYKHALTALAALGIANSLVALGIPWFSGQLLGSVVVGKTGSQSWLVGALVGALVVSAVITFAASSRGATTSARILADLRQRVYLHVQRLPIAFHHTTPKGDVLALMSYEIRRLSDYLTRTVVTLPAKALTTVGSMVLMYRINPRLAVVVPVLIPAFYLILKIAGRQLRTLAIALQGREADVIATAEEMLEMLPATKAFTREAEEADRYRRVVEACERLHIREGRINAALGPSVTVVAAVAAVIVLLLAGQRVQNGQMSTTQLFSFIFYAALLSRPVSELAHLYGQTQTALGTLARLNAVLERPIEVIGNDAALGRVRGRIRFENIHFAYPGTEPLFGGLNFDIAAGTIVAIVGPNGSGKTALLNLLLRYYEPQHGRILLDDTDIATVGVDDVRRQIGLVPQFPLLFNGTIRDNIAFGAVGATQAAIDAAASLAQATSFISALSEGMDTMIGDNGVRLSGGQRQKIALARALIKDPPILVFDEATSMFDDEGESGFVAACGDALKGRTVILVTHRPATLALATRIVGLEARHVREQSLKGTMASMGPARLSAP